MKKPLIEKNWKMVGMENGWEETARLAGKKCDICSNCGRVPPFREVLFCLARHIPSSIDCFSHGREAVCNLHANACSCSF